MIKLGNADRNPRKVTQKTIDVYLGHMRSMRNGILAEREKDNENENRHDVQPTDYAEYLIENISQYRPRTITSYRSALLYWLRSLEPTADVLHAEMLITQGIPKSGYKSHRPKGKPVTLYSTKSSNKRTYNKRDFDRLIKAITVGILREEKDARIGHSYSELQDWIFATVYSGLRPTEWQTAKWHDEENGILFTEGAKAKLDKLALPQAKGMYHHETSRTIPIEPNGRFWVSRHLARVQEHMKRAPFELYYGKVRRLLWRICKQTWGEKTKPPFTLYVFRGQYAANIKKELGLEVAAQRIGSSITTTSSHYGKKLYANAAHGSVGGGVMDESKIEQKEKPKASKTTTFTIARAKK